LGTNPSTAFIPASGYFGGLMYSNGSGATSPYIITGTNSFTQTGPATFSSTFTSGTITSGNLSGATLTFGGTASATPNSTIIDGNIYGATEGTNGATLTNVLGSPSSATQQLYLLSSAAAPAGAILTNGTLCNTCQFSQWGWWGGDVVSTTLGRTDIGNLNLWVAGQPTVTIPTGGTATYNGQMIGAVNNAGSHYVGTGTFALMQNFGVSGSNGTFTGTFDGTTFFPGGLPVSGTTAAGGPYTGSGNTTGITATVSGKFFGPNSTTPPETGGSFSYVNTGTAYAAGGVFLGHR
jgi:hypothetical protein